MNNRCSEWLSEKIEEIKNRENYTAEKTNENIAEKYGYRPSDIVKLNYNENLYLPKNRLSRMLKQVAQETDMRIYPQEEENRLREKLSEYVKVPKESIVIGNGSDELIDRTIRLFMKRNEPAISITPTFPIFRMCVKYQGGEYVGVPLQNDFTIDMETMLKTFTCNTRILYLVSPNNPTANQFSQNDVEKLTQNFPGIVLVDEAYAEFGKYSIIPLINKYENLIVLRTFSKAFGLASLRLGYAVTNLPLAQALGKLPDPYPVSTVSMSMGIKMLENLNVVKASIERLKKEREKLIHALNQIDGITAFNSDANFVLFTTNEASNTVYERFLRKAIIIKNVGKILGLNNCLRTTVGLPEMNARMIDILKEE